jgi:cell pole-organizing protein PopZ
MAEQAGKDAPYDPSMEDILASIRRILNDDGTPASGDGATPEAAEPAVQPAAPNGGTDVFVLDQTMLIEEPAVVTPQEPFASEHLASVTGREAPADAETLLSPSSAAAASASMGALVRVVGQQQTPVYRGGPTLEEMVRDEIRPLVKTWLDENLAPMVERMVRAEIARVTQGT